MGLNMINKYNNTVIQSKGGEHGKRVIEWWKEQGMDLDTYSGCSIGYYYGLIDSVFGYWRTLPANITIIELPESNPQDLSCLERKRNLVYDDTNVDTSEQNVDTSEQNVDTSPKIIDLSNVEGVKMMVSDDEENWFTRKIIAKRNDAVIDSILTKWYFFRPIEVKKVTMQQVEELFGCKVEIVKEVSNE